jgi:hypothetical protein
MFLADLLGLYTDQIGLLKISCKIFALTNRVSQYSRNDFDTLDFGSSESVQAVDKSGGFLIRRGMARILLPVIFTGTLTGLTARKRGSSRDDVANHALTCAQTVSTSCFPPHFVTDKTCLAESLALYPGHPDYRVHGPAECLPLYSPC